MQSVCRAVAGAQRSGWFKASLGLQAQSRLLSTQSLQDRLSDILPKQAQELNNLKKKYGNTVIDTCTVGQAIGGMRDVTSMFYETSLLDKNDGILYRGRSLESVIKQLPALDGCQYAASEGLLWLLLTGEMPNQEQVKMLKDDLARRAELSEFTQNSLANMPTHVHPMTQLSMAVLSMQPDSHFAAAYQDGTMSKNNQWEFALEDALNLIAKLPKAAATIYLNTFRSNRPSVKSTSLDWAGNYCSMMGFDSADAQELMRVYMLVHADHEGGNVSAHTTHLVGSALSDPYLSFSAGVCGLAGPLHGLANQEVLRWIQGFREKVGTDNPTDQQIEDALWDTLNSGQVIPGYGHAVLRHTDPRFTIQNDFAKGHLADSPLVKLVSQLYKVTPGVLTKHGKTKNPYPNVDAHSGVLLYSYGITEERYYTVMFAVSRALGVMSNYVLSRAFRLPIERPKSANMDLLRQLAQQAK